MFFIVALQYHFSQLVTVSNFFITFLIQIFNKIWGYDFYGDDRTLDTHVKLLRKSLERYSRCIITLRGVGYRFETIPEGDADA